MEIDVRKWKVLKKVLLIIKILKNKTKGYWCEVFRQVSINNKIHDKNIKKARKEWV
jgi:hypothetical protein